MLVGLTHERLVEGLYLPHHAYCGNIASGHPLGRPGKRVRLENWWAASRPSACRKHVGILGSSGSGKTVMGKVILEECALAGIPSIIIDVQGDRKPCDGSRGRPECRRRAPGHVVRVDGRTGLDPANKRRGAHLPRPVRPPSSDIDFTAGRMGRVGGRPDQPAGTRPRQAQGRQAKAFLYNHMTTLAEAGEAPTTSASSPSQSGG